MARMPARRRVLAVNLIACGLLFVQYVLGMAVNVFVTLPASHPGAGASNYFSGVGSGVSWAIGSGPVWVAAHAAFGVALVVAAIAAIPLARGVSRAATGLAVLAALCVIGAGFNGASFLNYLRTLTRRRRTPRPPAVRPLRHRGGVWCG